MIMSHRPQKGGPKKGVRSGGFRRPRPPPPFSVCYFPQFNFRWHPSGARARSSTHSVDVHRPVGPAGGRGPEGGGPEHPGGRGRRTAWENKEMGGAPRNPAPRNHFLVWIVKPSGSHCADAFGGKKHRGVPPPLRSTSLLSERRWTRLDDEVCRFSGRVHPA